jgi:hypothetical protein
MNQRTNEGWIFAILIALTLFIIGLVLLWL